MQAPVCELQSASLRSISVLDRLLLTHPVWLQLSLNSDSAQQVLHKEPPGAFLVRRCNASQKKVLCVRLTEDNSASSVRQCVIREEESTFSLESSAISFPDLCRLVAFYCVSRDILPSPLELPEAIAKASSHRQLESLSHLGIEFWSSPLNFRAACNGPPSGSQGALCFINPLFLREPASRGALHKRHRFKRSLRVRVSTETSMTLSSPPRSAELDGTEASLPLQKRASTAAGLLRRTPALSPTSEEEEELIPKDPPQVRGQVTGQGEEPAQEEGGVEAGLALERRRAPSLAELDSSSSFSSLEEAEEGGERPAPKPRAPASGLRRMSAAFVTLFAPERRVAQLVEELSRDRRSAFGALVQDFLQQQREELRAAASAVELLQGLRRFLSQAKGFLLDCGELEPPIETLVPENEKDLALEKAMFGCVLKPLKVQLDQALLSLHTQDGSTQRLADSLRSSQEGALERFGVRGSVPDARDVERVRQKLGLMQRTHSPIDKVLLLLQSCKYIYKAMGPPPGKEFGTEEFLPALSYVLVQCNLPHLLLEVEYMMELLEPSWLTGEGGYYLTSVYASLCLIQSHPDPVPPGGLTQGAQEALKEWSRRRTQDAQSQRDAQQNQRFVRVLFQEGDCSAVRTLQWKAGDSGEALAQLCAIKFGVTEPEQYALYWRDGGETRPVPPQAQPPDLPAHSGGGPTLIFLRSDQDPGKARKLTRGGAVDLGESVCEE
ncbi:ras and Rab interactor 2-like [Megalops cyprinoides]|uniref:ras and Rab interactor 2-like n=1 Tax=Megalops cyprinoides TaxID=118141 RepID=UPI0018644FBF|nr:ras and Rab interactor 2-like [Megalops cyprinoides]